MHTFVEERVLERNRAGVRNEPADGAAAEGLPRALRHGQRQTALAREDRRRAPTADEFAQHAIAEVELLPPAEWQFIEAVGVEDVANVKARNAIVHVGEEAVLEFGYAVLRDAAVGVERFRERVVEVE